MEKRILVLFIIHPNGILAAEYLYGMATGTLYNVLSGTTIGTGLNPKLNMVE